MKKQSIDLLDNECQSASEGPLSVAEFTQLVAHYKRVSYEAYYSWKLSQFYQQTHWAAESRDNVVYALSTT